MNEVIFRNLGTVNKNTVRIGKLQLWFSYETPVAYKVGSENIVVRKNDWSTTTGKLLNDLEPDKSKRIDGQIFVEQLEKLVSEIVFQEN